MALIVEIGLGLPAATENSYVTSVESDAYHLARGRELTWVDLDDEVKEQHLIMATQQLEARYRQLWKGTKRLSDNADSPTVNDPLVQALGWPRKDVKDEDGVLLDRKLIPVAVKNAQMEVAFILASGSQFVESSIDRSTSGTIREKVGPIDVMYKESAQGAPVYPLIDMILQPILGSPGFNTLSVNIGFTDAELEKIDANAAFVPSDYPEYFDVI